MDTHHPVMDFLLNPPSSRLYERGKGHNAEFIAPPLDGSLTIPELYDFHYEHNPNHPVFLFDSPPHGLTFIPFSEVVPAAYNAARFVARMTNIDLQNQESLRPTIAILAATDTITYFTTVLGMLRAEITVFVISPRNSSPAVAHLLSRVRPSHILVSTEAPIRDLARSAVLELNQSAPTICSMPTYEDIYIPGSSFLPLPPRRHDFSATRVIVHSSGSASFPKPVTWSDRSYLQAAIVPLFGAHELCSEIFGCHAITMFHGIGLNFIGWVASTGLIMSTFPPVSPSITPTPESVWDASLSMAPAYLFGPPVFFEGWSRDPSKLPFLKGLKGLVYGGGPLHKPAGDYLAKEGVAIYTLYGATEAGVYGVIFPRDPKLDWEYITMNPHCSAEFVPLGDGTYELIVLAKPTTELTILNTKFNGQDAYATSDILIPHPTVPGRWKVLGRLDDQIVLNTGEKTNPGPLEAILCEHPHVASAVMFGRGRFQNGVLLEIKKEFAFDSRDSQRLREFRDTIQPQIEALNAAAPTHSRLFKELVIVSDPSKPFSYTAKGAPRRAAILSDYDVDIEALYNEVGKSSQISPPDRWSAESSLIFVRAAVNEVLRRPAADHDDIFERGCDSLQANWIRQTILRGISLSTGVDTSKASRNFVYEHPTIVTLAEYVRSLADRGHALSNGVLSLVQDIESFLVSYTNGFPVHKPCISGSFFRKGDVILVTGTTGSLGTAVLAKLVQSDSISKIYAFNRRSTKGEGMLPRQGAALRSRGYDEKLAKSPKVVFVEGSLTRTGLGIEHVLQEEIRRSVTHIIHIAWRVDFNLSLASFENMVGGVRALVDLALSSPRVSPPRLLFTSSVGVLRNCTSNVPVPELPIEEPSVALGQGYSEAKWVSEQILYRAAKATPLRPIVVRVGQISGGINGSWNPSDWVPAIVKSSLRIGFLPELKGSCSWIPLDLAARALVELRSAEIETAHLVHPHPVPCREVFKIIGEDLALTHRPYAEWVMALDKLAATEGHAVTDPPIVSNQRSDSLPAAKTLQFYKSAVEREDESRDAMGIPKLDVTQALARSDALLGSAGQMLSPDNIRQWLNYWRNIAFIP